MSVTVAIETHGCKLNQAESEALAYALLNAGYRVVNTREHPDVYILNTCTVTHVADSKARQALRAVRRRNPDVSLVAVGCYARRASEKLAEIGGCTVLGVGAGEREHILRELTGIVERRAEVETALAERGPCSLPGTGRTRAMVKIQEGCRYACAYCIVPSVRGRPDSTPPDSVIAEVSQRVKEGYREVVLTGTQPGCYGYDLRGTSLPGLLRRILDETEVDRVRVSSIQPQELTPELLDLWGNSRLCPHVHMPLQSGSVRTLRAMGRGYTPEYYMDTLRTLRKAVPDVSVTTDVMVGFPDEGEEEFGESLRFCEEAGFSKVHVFPFSARPGTRAAGMGPKVLPAELSKRMGRMLSLSRELEGRVRYLAVGQTRPVLWEGLRNVSGVKIWSGLTDTYLRVVMSDPSDMTNRITRAELREVRDGVLWARIPGRVA